jgi:hypothetical protein
MEKKPAERIYKFSDAILVIKSNNILTCCRRDATEFDERNKTEANTFTPLQTEVDAFKNLPTDEELEGAKMEFTEIKAAKKDALKKQIGRIMTSAANIFGVNSAKYYRFGTKGMDAMDEPELLKCARRVARTAGSFASQLATEGVTAAMIAAVLTTAQEYEDAIDDQKDAANDRNIAAEERIEMGNALYDKVVKLSNTGKDIWSSVNEAKYNDYIIYNTVSGEKEDDNTPANTPSN